MPGADGVGRVGELHGPAVDLDDAAGRADAAGERGEELVLALALERDDADDLAVAELEGDVLELGADAAGFAPRAAAGRRRRGGGRRRARPAARARSMRAPSISSTMRSSTPGAMSTTPTVSPSRSTVARSQSAEISRKRWEMKMTERPAAALAADDVEHPLGEVGRQRGGHLVEEQHVGLERQRAREVEDALHGEREVAGDLAQVEVGRRRARAPSRRNGATGVPVSRRLSATSRSGISAGSW